MKRKKYVKKVFILFDNELCRFGKVYRSFMAAVHNCKEYESIGVFKEFDGYRDFVKFVDVSWNNGLPIFKGL